MKKFLDITDGRKGLAVLTDSITEYEVSRENTGNVDLTLFRSVRNKICTEFRSYSYYRDQKGGQLIQKLTFDFSLYPHVGDWKSGDVLRRAEEVIIGSLAYQFNGGQGGELHEIDSLFSLDAENIHLSGIKKSENNRGMIVRLWNSSDECEKCTLQFHRTIRTAFECRLDETFENNISIGDERTQLLLEVKPFGIKTVYVELNLTNGE
jgi:mannosylglycerate hydrolase